MLKRQTLAITFTYKGAEELYVNPQLDWCQINVEITFIRKLLPGKKEKKKKLYRRLIEINNNNIPNNIFVVESW